MSSATGAGAETGEVVSEGDAAQADALAFELVPVTRVDQGGLTAEGIARRIVEVAPETRRASAEAAFAELRADRAYSLFLPRVEVSASYTRLSQVPEFNPFFPVILNRIGLQATVRVPVSDYFLTLNEHYASAKKLAIVSDLQRRGESLAATYQVLKEYYELAQAVAARNLAAYRVGQLEKFVEEVRILVEGGEQGRAQLAQARAGLAGAQTQATRALATQRIAEQRLRSRLAFSSGSPIGIGESLMERVPPPPSGLASLVKAAQAERAEALALRELYAAREHARDATAMARWPTLSLFGDVTYANPNQRYLPPSERFDASWAVGAELSWSPTDLAVQQTNLDEARLEIARVVEDMRALHGRIEIEVTAAYENALAAHSAIETARATIAAADETHRLQRALFFAGESTSRDVLDPELELRNAQLQWLDAVLATHLAHAAIAHATGKKLPD